MHRAYQAVCRNHSLSQTLGQFEVLSVIILPASKCTSLTLSTYIRILGMSRARYIYVWFPRAPGMTFCLGLIQIGSSGETQDTARSIGRRIDNTDRLGTGDVIVYQDTSGRLRRQIRTAWRGRPTQGRLLLQALRPRFILIDLLRENRNLLPSRLYSILSNKQV